MVSGVQKAFPACVRSIRRGDVYYADFGSVEDAVGHELAKKRPVLIIQNNFGNKKSTTTICLCLTTKCKYGLPYHVHFNDLNIDYKLLTTGEETVTAKNFKRFPKIFRPITFDYGYCITCHKSQGSEYNKVLVFEEYLKGNDHARWLYTAATRAKEKLIIVKGE